MTVEPSGDRDSAAVRLLAREKRIAALESGEDLLVEAAPPGESMACLHGPLLRDPARVGLVVVPDPAHGLCAAARASGLPVRAIVVTPDMSEAERRDLGIALQRHTVQLLFVTPERLSQPRFVQFIRGLSLVYVAVASCQRLARESGPYEVCRTLRGLFPGMPLLALADSVLVEGERTLIEVALAFSSDSKTQHNETPRKPQLVEQAVPVVPVVREVPPPPTPEPPLRSKVVPEQYQSAFVRFEQDLSVAEAAVVLARDEAWVWQALVAFIQYTGRTHPFPWVSKPTYMTVSMAAGQAETTNARLIASVLRGMVEEREIQVVLAALDNRNGAR